MPGKLIVYDDESTNVNAWKIRLDKVQKKFKVIAVVDRSEFLNGVKGLEERRARAGKGASGNEQNIFDEADILIVDYDLLPRDSSVQADARFITGERISYLARCYSACKYIVALNQYGKNPFDLTLKGHLGSFADLNLGFMQIDNPGLWEGNSSGFRPWYWPVIPEAVRRQEIRTTQLMGNLDRKISEVLDLDLDTLNLIDPTALEFLSRDKQPQQVTIRDFLLRSGNGYRGKDIYPDENYAARVAASRLEKWLEKAVLSAQNVLVDLPHLLSRYPSLLKGKKTSLKEWNEAFTFSSFSKTRVNCKILEDTYYKFERDGWLSRPAWFWHRLARCDEIEEVSRPWDATASSNFVFCEDISQFEKISDSREFVAQVPPPFVRRFCVGTGKSLSKKVRESLREVEYIPLVRLIS